MADGAINCAYLSNNINTNIHLTSELLALDAFLVKYYEFM